MTVVSTINTTTIRPGPNTIGTAKNKTPCEACRDLHKRVLLTLNFRVFFGPDGVTQCDTSEGFPCKGCKTDQRKARACRPTTKLRKPRSVEVDDVNETSSEELEANQACIAQAPAPERQAEGAQAHLMQFDSGDTTSNENHQDVSMALASHQYLPFFDGNSHGVSNVNEWNPVPCDNILIPFETGTVQNLQTYSDFGGIPAEHPMNIGFDYANGAASSNAQLGADGIHEQMHGAFSGLYNEQTGQSYQYPFGFQNDSSIGF
ncbi:hypothetical protein SCHPADRAFT_895098 [Schizopora paradoxa]|uniref:Uncharacterized protein n=1 Tax=Schizopora paradoxa TaxID=27342 RepID=A0A0H2R4Z2_9AGAM|nr:hypothetical protein SCHPADRAFT_895098 [Schizopora paradoxa]